jgi:hypothetical protein
VQVVHGQAIEVEEVREPGMQQDVVRAGLGGSSNERGARLARRRSRKILRQADRIDPEDVLVVPVGRAQLRSEQRRE